MRLTSRFSKLGLSRRRSSPSKPLARTRLLLEPLESRTVLDISINFVGGTGPGGSIPPMDPGEVAGVVPRPNWNNAEGQVSYFSGLVDHTGAAVSAFLAYDANNTWTTGIPDEPGNNRMMGGYLDSSASSTTIVVIFGISSHITGPYDVYVYFNGDTHGSRFGYYTALFWETKVGFDPAPFKGGFVEDTGKGGNYLKFSGVPYDPLILLATPQSPFGSENGFRAPINGIQIVPASGAPGGGGQTRLGDPDLVAALAPIDAPLSIAPQPATLQAVRAAPAAAVDAFFTPAAQKEAYVSEPAEPVTQALTGDLFSLEQIGTFA
jgi:hypothetical protein